MNPILAPQKAVAAAGRETMRRLFLACAVTLLAASPASAQRDRVYLQQGSTTSGGVTEVTRDGVVVRVGSNNQQIGIDQIRWIMFEGDPPQLTRGRELAMEGQYAQALEELQRVDVNALRRDVVKAEAAFYRALAQSRQALAGQGDKNAAQQALLRFVQQYPQSWHYYATARLLGDLAVARQDFEAAQRYYRALAQAPPALYQQQSQYLVSLSQLRQGKAEEARAGFEQVIQAKTDSPEAVRLRQLARVGLAAATAVGGDAEEGLKMIDQLIEESDPNDRELAARIYNARGQCQLALGDPEGAVMDYLHTHLLFSGEPDAHAEALSQLVQLWPQVGRPERANAARQELQSRYPGWGD